MAIQFHTENPSFKLKKSLAIKRWVKAIVEKEKKIPGNINYIFVTDEHLYKMNVQFLNHKTYTDIITFDYSDRNKVEGDIYISTDRVIENADKFNSDIETELHRVIIHGVLHLCGYKDKTPKDAKKMRLMEDRSLALRAF